MTTPGRYRRLNEAADLYLEFGVTTMNLCEAIKKLHGGLRFEGEDSPENEEWRTTSLAIAKAVEEAFHNILDPYVTRLEQIDKAIKDNLPKPPGSIILPGEDKN